LSGQQIAPWLDAAAQPIRAAFRADRMPHGLLIHEAPGAGGDWLATWIAQLVLCTQGERAPCGECNACRRVAAGQHPDLLELRLQEESKQIRIEQVRELAQDLALTPHQGGYRVGVISPADALNRFAANALLKTLEEPPARTVLMLVATQPSRLPATILSRCQRIRISAPPRDQSLNWLERSQGPQNWAAVLDVMGESPLLAAKADAAAVVQIGAEVRQELEATLAGRTDPLVLAEKWARSELPLRLRCIENWITDRIRGPLRAPGLLTEVGAGTHLPGRQTVLNIRRAFELLDGVRELKSALETPINRGLALESLLRRLTPLKS